MKPNEPGRYKVKYWEPSIFGKEVKQITIEQQGYWKEHTVTVKKAGRGFTVIPDPPYHIPCSLSEVADDREWEKID